MDVDFDWRSWARHRLAPYWYGVLAVFLDIALVASILGAFRASGAGAYGIAVTFLVFAVYVELEVYGRLWPSRDVAVVPQERKAAKVRKLRAKAVDNPAAGEADAVVPETHE